MKRQIITLGLTVCALTSFAQWTLVKKINKPTRFIESTQQGIIVATDSSYYVQQDPTFQNWAKYTLNDAIQDMDSKGVYVYFATSKRIYEHLTAPSKIRELTNSYSFSSINIYKGKKMVSINGNSGFELFCTFTSSTSQFDTLDYFTTKRIWSLMSISSDDSLALLGYSNYFGAKLFNEQSKKWEGLSPLELEVIYDSYVSNQTIMTRFSKAGTDFYISHDYGKTYKTKTDAFPFNSTTGSVMEYYNGNAFIGFSDNYIKGVFQSSNDGQSWTNILADSSITGLAIKENELFATTTKGSLLKTTINSILNSIDQVNDKFTKLYYQNRAIYNNTTDEVEYVIHDLTGKKISSGMIAPSNQTLPNLKEGIYIVEYRNNKITSREKIYVW